MSASTRKGELMAQQETAAERAFLFRTDSSKLIGTGHVMRCVRIAEALCAAGENVAFICRRLEGSKVDYVKTKGFHVFGLDQGIESEVLTDEPADDCWLPVSEEVDASQTIEILSKFEGATLIVDHYALGIAWERAVRPSVSRLVCVDDLPPREHHCDVYINPSRLSLRPSDLAPYLSEGCRTLVGPRYAMLSPAFAEINKQRKAGVSANGDAIFICFGGMDRDGWTFKVIEIFMRPEFLRYKLEVVVGSSFPMVDRLKKMAEDRGLMVIHQDVSNVFDVMAKCQIGIGAGGTMSWERLSAGLPSVALGIADNQNELISDLVCNGLCVGCSVNSETSQDYIACLVQYLIENSALQESIREKGLLTVDGNGIARVLSLLTQNPISFREASTEDVDSIFEWRSHKEILEVSESGERNLSYEKHVEWMHGVLGDDKRVLLIAEIDDEPIGVCRFDLSDCGEAIISVYSVPESKKRGGLIRASSSWIFDNYPSVKSVHAIVLEENKKSMHAFLSCGYEQKKSTYVLSRK